MKNNISALVLVKNEEESINGCLKQLSFVDEIIVLDQDSQDKTCDIARKYTYKIFSTNGLAFDKNRELLASYAKCNWLLYIDADERLTTTGITEIKKTISQDTFDAYYFPRRNYILGKFLKHGGWWPDYTPRLFKKNKLKGWFGQVHESPRVEGELSYLKEPINHYTARSVSAMLAKTTIWARIEAKLYFQAKHSKVTIFKVVKAFFSEFLSRYIIKLGFLDGRIGLVEAIYQAYHRCAVLIYLWELQTDASAKFKQVKV